MVSLICCDVEISESEEEKRRKWVDTPLNIDMSNSNKVDGYKKEIHKGKDVEKMD